MNDRDGGAGLKADFVIVGAGTAGAVLADRLTECGRFSVILVEAGGSDRPLKRHPKEMFAALNIHIPAGFQRVYAEPAFNWNYVSEPEPELHGRRMPLPRGKIMGGSSSINGMIHVRGLPLDYDCWSRSGCQGWSYDEVLPWFRKLETFAGGPDSHHGGEGPVHVSPSRIGNAVTEAVKEAFRQSGRPPTADMNGPDPEGPGDTQFAVGGGLRQSTAQTYLKRALPRPNLTVVSDTMVERLVIEDGRTTGVSICRSSKRETIRADREVILSAGALNSPKLLQLSGIGPATLLRTFGIDVVHDSPAVGENLQDHYYFHSAIRLRPDAPSINSIRRKWPLAKELARYALTRGGVLAHGPVLVTGFVRSRLSLDAPDLQLFSSPATIDGKLTSRSGGMVLENRPGLTMNMYNSRPKSRGHVRIASSDPAEPPRVLHNYLSHESDRQILLDAFRLMGEIATQPALRPYVDHFVTPDPATSGEHELMEHIRNAGTTAFHECGTVAMGPHEADPIDPRLRVRGVRNLRVVDASVMPTITSGNTNAPVLMIAEKAAGMIRSDHIGPDP